MGFRVTARTILHLGSELISSDGVAFYELIKNSLDARSPEVKIDVVQRMGFQSYDVILQRLGERRSSDAQSDSSLGKSTRAWKEIRRLALDAIDREAPDADELIEEINQAKTKGEFVGVVREANYIDVEDDGEGMSAKILRDVYLTIGTSNRARQREKELARAAVGDGEEGEGKWGDLGGKGLGSSVSDAARRCDGSNYRGRRR